MPNLNGRSFVETSVASVLKSAYSSFELIFIDDCSTDGSFEFVSDRFASDPRLILLRNERNLGAAAARNRAVSRSRGEILVFLDNDTEVESTWISELMDAFLDQRVSAAQAKIRDFYHRSVIQHVGVCLIPFTAWAVARGGGEVDCGQWDRPDEVLALTTCLAVRRSAFEHVRGFDERLVAYSEDIDFSWRMWLSRLRTIVVPSATVYHRNKTVEERKVMNGNEYEITFYLERNALRITLKNLALERTLISIPEGLIISFTMGGLTCLRTGSGDRLRALIYALVWNVKFLKDTLRQRNMVQSLRKASDSWISKKIMDQRSFAFHVARYLRLQTSKKA
jgi:GT2 family glycosyltransferase